MLLIVFITVTWVNLNHERWKGKSVIDGDVVSYYAYLPATFIEHDLSLSFLKHPGQSSGVYWPNTAPNGNFVIKMSMGMAIAYSPFFCLAHVYAKLFNYQADGFSEPYHFAILFSSLCYYLFGLMFLFRILRRYFTETISVLTLLCFTFGTNVFYYLTLGAGLSHIVNFSLCSVFLFYALQYIELKTLKPLLILSAVGGFMVLIRPINILLFLFPLVAEVLKLKENFFSGKNLFHYLLMLVVVTLVFMPQLIYWKHITGQFLFNSYVGEGFYFNNPHVFYGLFSFRKGWLLYTPLMIFALAGINFMKHNLERYVLPLLVFLSVYLYVCFSWWCWWYGGSFGQRVMIDVYPLLTLPFASLLTRVPALSNILKSTVIALISACVLLNLFQTMQAKYNILHYDSMTRDNYFEIFFTTTRKPDSEKHLQHPDYQRALRGENEY